MGGMGAQRKAATGGCRAALVLSGVIGSMAFAPSSMLRPQASA
eukprot:CAMPEP_0173459464 /NCGR_PEP_ID=MMETSP1357-20121228/61425_1 /TAXON_ID=77926 /ORGANISM="Hemiselmis rufescens, Strain PCC563" /LENGTH=42 /DNA_ID= /DNA_START= /DNA_END= /DNA_ORIENTATION=